MQMEMVWTYTKISTQQPGKTGFGLRCCQKEKKGQPANTWKRTK